MGEHRFKTGIKGDEYKRIQRIGGSVRVLAHGSSISAKRLMLQRTPKGAVLVPAPEPSQDLHAKIRRAITKRLETGIGQSERIERKHGSR